MKSIFRPLFLIFCSLISWESRGQSVNPVLFTERWPASWITVPEASPTGYGVYLFRKSITLLSKPASFTVHVSADNRYKLYVNEKQVSLGPARGDLEHWNFETVDLAPFLQAGNNVIAAMVWNEASLRPEGEISLQTGFILQGDGQTEQIINTNSSWKCIRDSSYEPLVVRIPNTYYVAGPGELIRMDLHPDGWNSPGFPEAGWKNATELTPGKPKNIMGGYGTVSDWMLVPSIIPGMELKDQRLQKLSSSQGVIIPAGFPSSKIPVQIPANSHVNIILDQGFLTNAYPEMIFSGGKNATVSIEYAESMFTRYPSKGNRNETAGKVFIGRKDSILSNGRINQVFIPLAYRTYRYVQLRIQTKENPLAIEDFHGTATGYPFRMNAALDSDIPDMQQILETGWRTARMCAMETYMDCPYYEQLQYLGDTRIQSLVSLYNSGDDRLVKNAINDFDHSRIPEGLTYGRHPSLTPQYIPTFSFWYIGMLHDYMMYGKDTAFTKSKLAGGRQVMNYFRNHQQPDGSLVGVPHWMFTDWVQAKDWVSGTGPVGKDGCSALFDLQLLWAYELAADLESRIGMEAFSKLYTQYAEELKSTIRKKYWDEGRKLFADRPEKDLFSQHANALAILTGMFDSRDMLLTGNKLLTDTTLAPASIYFKFYLHFALVKAGMGDSYLDWLGIWRENLKMGMTTWAEISDINNSRSDCHAWGSSPNIEFFRTVLGIDSDAPGFTKIKIEPHLGNIKKISGEMPHPLGKIKTAYVFKNSKWNVQIDLPETVTGNLIWHNQSFPLKSGSNEFAF